MTEATFDIHSEFGELLSEHLRDWLGCSPIEHGGAKLVSANAAKGETWTWFCNLDLFDVSTGLTLLVALGPLFYTRRQVIEGFRPHVVYERSAEARPGSVLEAQPRPNPTLTVSSNTLAAKPRSRKLSAGCRKSVCH
ncbi:MAG: hypothetical protein U5S82_15100 [Gammaproteobacteria bacterium]|nr:hypothetical protein [Gammaproteobacteria bacterium]